MEVRIAKSKLQCSEAGDDDCLASPPGLRTGGPGALSDRQSGSRAGICRHGLPEFLFSWPAQIAPQAQTRLVKDLFPHLSSVDRTSVVSGKRVSVRVDLGGRRVITTKKQIRSKAISQHTHKK